MAKTKKRIPPTVMKAIWLGKNIVSVTEKLSLFLFRSNFLEPQQLLINHRNLNFTKYWVEKGNFYLIGWALFRSLNNRFTLLVFLALKK